MPESTTELERITALQQEATPVAATELQKLGETTTDKEARKAARRALYLLSQKGIQPAPQEIPASVSQPHEATTDTLRSYASAYDGAGNRLLFFELADPDGGHPTLIQILVNDEKGVTDVDGRRMPQREVTERLKRYSDQMEQGLAFAEIEGDYARWLLDEGREINRRVTRPTPRGFLEWLSRIGPPRQKHDTFPIWTRYRPEEIRAEADLPRDPVTLFALPWFNPWFFAVEDVVPWLQGWEQAGTSTIELSEKVKEERRQKVVTEAVEALVGPEARHRQMRRLEETADILRRRGKEVEARQALFHALALADNTSVAQVPFARQLVQRTLEAAMDMVNEARAKQAQQPQR